MSLRDSPEPSVNDSGVTLTPASFRNVFTTSSPAASLVRMLFVVVAAGPATLPSVRKIISVYRFWLGFNVCAATTLNGGDCMLAISRRAGACGAGPIAKKLAAGIVRDLPVT